MFGYLKNLLSWSATPTPTDIGEYIRLMSQGNTSSSGEIITPRTILRHPAVWNAVSLISSTAARVSYDVYRDDSREKARNHFAQKLMKRPGNYDRISLLSAWIVNALTHGNGYIWILRDDIGRPVDLVLLDSGSTAIVIDNGRIYYTVWIDNRQRKIDQGDVLHLKGLSNDGLSGLPLYQILAETFGLGLTLQKWQNVFFKNNARPSLVIHLPPEIKTPEKINEFREAWGETHNLTNAHKPALMMNGGKVESFGGEVETLPDLHERDVVAIAQIFSIPAYKIGGRLSSVAYGSVQQEQLSFLDSIDFWVSQIEQVLSRGLLSTRQYDTGSHYIEGNRKNLIKITPEIEAELLTKYHEAGLISDEEAREALNRSTDMSVGQFWKKSGLVPRDQALQPPTVEVPTVEPVEDEPVEQPEDEPIEQPEVEPVEDQPEETTTEPSNEAAFSLTQKSVGRLLRRAEKSGKIEIEIWNDEFASLPGVSKLADLLPIDELAQVLPEQRQYVLGDLNAETITGELWTTE